jgi:hypothetical protein
LRIDVEDEVRDLIYGWRTGAVELVTAASPHRPGGSGGGDGRVLAGEQRPAGPERSAGTHPTLP